MKSVKCDLSNNYKNIELYILSDLHVGDPRCDIKKIRKRIGEIQNKDNAFCLLLGDLINNSTKTSVSDIYEEQLSPMKQMELVIELLKPISNKILGATSGNHEFRSYKTDGIDITRIICNELGIKNFDPVSLLLFIRFGKMQNGKKDAYGAARRMSYSIYLTHGTGSGRTIGAKANGLQRLGQIVNADICVIGHTHLPLTFKDMNYEVDKPHSVIREKETIYVNAGSSLNYGGYAEQYSLKPSSKADPIILLDGNRFNINVRL